MSLLLIKNGTIITTTGRQKANVFIENGVVHIRDTQYEIRNTNTVIDATGLLLFPGLIDCHVHFREPGLEHKGNMQSESRSARAGGVTTVCDMPNTIPPTTSIAALADKVERASLVGNCDIHFFFGATTSSHLQELRKLWTNEENRDLKQRCCGLKLFLDHSTGDQKAEASLVEEAFSICAELDIPIIAHCEDAEINAEAIAHAKRDSIASHSDMRPPESEVHAVNEVLALVRKYGAQFHVAHLSTIGALQLVREAKNEGLPVTCEVTPHHLFMDIGHYEKFGTLVKMNPPLRSTVEREALWQGVADGTIDCIATDHAPHTLEEKNVDDPFRAPSGVPEVETMLPLLLTAASKKALSYERIFELCFANPNHIFRLGKSEIVDGASPDIVLVDPKDRWVVHAAQLHAKCGWTPFEGTELIGKVIATLCPNDGYILQEESSLPIV